MLFGRSREKNREKIEKKIAQIEKRITEAACMAHAQRKIHDVRVRHPTANTTEALNRIGELYAIVSGIRGSPAEERLAVRKKNRAIQLL